MKIKLNSFLILCFFVTMLVSSCNFSNQKTDVYYYYPKNSKLTIEYLRNSLWMNVSDSNIILLVDICEDLYCQSYHLIFFDKNLELIGGCFYPTEFIDSLSNNEVVQS